jgi:hypothetical protein
MYVYYLNISTVLCIHKKLQTKLIKRRRFVQFISTHTHTHLHKINMDGQVCTFLHCTRLYMKENFQTSFSSTFPTPRSKFICVFMCWVLVHVCVCVCVCILYVII